MVETAVLDTLGATVVGAGVDMVVRREEDDVVDRSDVNKFRRGWRDQGRGFVKLNPTSD